MITLLWSYFKDYKKLLTIVAICSVIIAAVNLMEPYLTAKFIDEILITKDSETFYTFILILLIINILAITSNWLSTMGSSKMRVAINNQLIEDVMEHIYKVKGNVIFKTDMIYLSKRIERDANDLVFFAINSMIDVFINFFLLCMAFLLLWSIGIKWCIIFLVISLLHTAVYKSLKKILFDRATATYETESKYFTALSDIFLYIYSIKLHSLYENYFQKFREIFKKYAEATISQVKIEFWFARSSVNANVIFKVLIFLLGGMDVLNGEMTIGNFVALNGYYMTAMSGVAYFMNIGENYQKALAAYTRIMELKNMPPEINGTKILDHITEINMCNVEYMIDKQKILADFNFSFKRGYIYCIYGKNGAGKTTLINLICGLLRPISGKINYDDTPTEQIEMIDARKRLIAVVEQKDFLKNDQLSGGERRRISIENAFYKNSDVLIMDEPDNNLDATAVSDLIKKIIRNKENRITIVISHDDRIVAIADKVIDLSKLQ